MVGGRKFLANHCSSKRTTFTHVSSAFFVCKVAWAASPCVAYPRLRAVLRATSKSTAIFLILHITGVLHPCSPARSHDNPAVIEIPYRVRREDIEEAKKVLITPTATARPPKAPTGRGVFGWVLFIGLAIALFLILQKRPAKDSAVSAAVNTPADHAMAQAIMAFFSGIAALIVGLFMSRWLQRRDEQHKLDRIETWVLGAEGVEQIAGPKRLFWYWRRFNSFAETDTLFVLRESPQIGRVLPKRLLANEAMAASVRALLVEKLVKPVAALEHESSGGA